MKHLRIKDSLGVEHTIDLKHNMSWNAYEKVLKVYTQPTSITNPNYNVKELTAVYFNYIYAIEVS